MKCSGKRALPTFWNQLQAEIQSNYFKHDYLYRSPNSVVRIALTPQLFSQSRRGENQDLQIKSDRYIMGKIEVMGEYCEYSG